MTEQTSGRKPRIKVGHMWKVAQGLMCLPDGTVHTVAAGEFELKTPGRYRNVPNKGDERTITVPEPDDK